MSTQSANALSRGLLSAQTRPGQTLKTGGLSMNGALLFVMSLLVVASGFKSMRPEVMGLMLHPYLVPSALAFPFVLMTRIGKFPMRILMAFLVFTGMYCFSLSNGVQIAQGEIFKISAALVTIITCALLVRSRTDFVMAVLGLSIAVAALAWHGLQEPTKLGVEAMQGANKNSYSLFALPPLLMSGFIFLRMPTVHVVIRTLLVLCAIPCLMAIFMSANRSGYLGVVVIALMLFWGRRGKGLVLVGLIAATVAFLMIRMNTTSVFDARMKETVEGNASDQYRKDILWACLDIGMKNPLVGVGLALPEEIGRRTSLKFHAGLIEAHNVFAHVFAGSGLICFAAMMAVGWTLYFWKPRNGVEVEGKQDPLYDARSMMRMIVVLWFVRGNFTREILYTPAFCIALGLGIGMCMLAENQREAIAAAAKRLRTPRPPAALPEGAA